MKVSGAQILFKALEMEKVEVIFGYPGGAVIGIYDELYRQKVRHILVRHEQGAIHAADGYARASGKVGVCLVTSGPGATNTVTGIANAHSDSIPVVILTGQVPTPLIGSDAFQEVDIMGITRPCTKHNFLVRNVAELGKVVREAFHIARSGRPGPVLVDLPKDVMQAEMEEADVCFQSGYQYAEEMPAASAIDKAAAMVAAARNPLVFAGGGVSLGKASGELRELARMIGAPVTSTLMGLGAFPASDPLWLGMAGMHGTYAANMAFTNCDLVIGVGVRFDDRVTSKVEAFAPRAQIIHIDIDPVSIDKIVRTNLSIVADAKQALSVLVARLKERNDLQPGAIKDWQEQVMTWKREHPLGYKSNGDVIKPQFVVEKLYELSQGKAVIATEVGQNQMWAAQFFQYNEPNCFLTSGGLGTMGFGFPAAIGAQVACPDKLVIDVAGDGSIQMNIQELGTAVQNKLPVKIAILNNSFLGMVRQWQEKFYQKRYSQTILDDNPDFLKIAEAYGAKGLRARTVAEVEEVIKEAFATEGVVVMDFIVDREEGVYPMVKPGAPLNEIDFGPMATKGAAVAENGDDPFTRSFN
ncbi:MAG: biosynthetic-type acetolactate synthase large subunit [Syntrophobacterales bacterium]|nr:biosynthetic-type acetolactate synthase large subunit [Syntrophobacterales bacterium]